MARITLTWDCADPDAMAAFWSEVLGFQLGRGVAQYRSLHPGDSPRYALGARILFQGVPEPKTGKNRLHLDLDLDPATPLGDEVARVVALGATRLYTRDEFGMTWQTLQDPEGNEFCIVATAASDNPVNGEKRPSAS